MGIIAPRPRSCEQGGLKGASSVGNLQVLAGRRLTGHRKPGANGERGALGLEKCNGAPVHSPKASPMHFFWMGLAIYMLKMKRAAASVPLESVPGLYISPAMEILEAKFVKLTASDAKKTESLKQLKAEIAKTKQKMDLELKQMRAKSAAAIMRAKTAEERDKKSQKEIASLKKHIATLSAQLANQKQGR